METHGRKDATNADNALEAHAEPVGAIADDGVLEEALDSEADDVPSPPPVEAASPRAAQAASPPGPADQAAEHTVIYGGPTENAQAFVLGDLQLQVDHGELEGGVHPANHELAYLDEGFPLPEVGFAPEADHESEDDAQELQLAEALDDPAFNDPHEVVADLLDVGNGVPAEEGDQDTEDDGIAEQGVHYIPTTLCVFFSN